MQNQGFLYGLELRGDDGQHRQTDRDRQTDRQRVRERESEREREKERERSGLTWNLLRCRTRAFCMVLSCVEMTDSIDRQIEIDRQTDRE